MHFGSRYDYLGYQRVKSGFGLPTWTHQEPYIFKRPSFLWWWQGNRVNTIGDSLTIKIGGDPQVKKPKNANIQNNRIKSTKYTIVTFLPQNLLEQFRRIANFYFLVMSVIALLIESPVSPLTSLAPLIFVIAVTASKQGYEDYLRYKADNMVNYSLVTVIRNGTEVDVKCQDIMQGDLVKVARDCDVPCDIILLKSSDPNGRCHVTTANLDGETNLKTLQTPKGLPNLDIDKIHTLGTIECEPPRTDLYTFSGKIELSNVHRTTTLLSETNCTDFHGIPLMAENLLLRGSRIKNTEWVVGCAVYTGPLTKLALNSRLTRNKVASSEEYINRFLIFVLILLLFVVTVCYFMKRYYDELVLECNSYIGAKFGGYKITAFLQDYLSFLILFNYLIPISLYVSVELHKFLGAFFLEWDPHLYDEETDQPCIVNTSDLNEELGQVKILFSDKTGTLTKNEMNFQQCSIKGRKFLYKGSSLQEEGTQFSVKIHKFNDDQFVFFQALAICHTVQVAGTIDEDVEEEVEITPAEEVERVYSFTNIKEESETSHRTESEVDETDFVQVSRPALNATFDKKPLMSRPNGDTTKKILNNNRIYPTLDLELPTKQRNGAPENFPSNNEFIRNDLRSATIPENAFPPTPNGRPVSLIFNRSNSHLDVLSDVEKPSYQTHRRTQSYGAPGSFQKQTASSTSIKRSSTMLRRSGSTTSTRESYAAPQFTTNSLQRKASRRRRDEIKSVVEKLDYQASSPDEKALVEACATIGLIYLGDENDVITVQTCPPNMGPVTSNCTKMNFKRLHVLEFTSDRKRMSTIVKDKKGDIWIYTKGAESYVFPLCTNTRPGLVNQTNCHISDFAKLGLRTLAVARRKIRQDEYLDFQTDLLRANSSLTERKRLVEACYLKVETKLELLGATAVEDALQDNVRDTLESLEAAGIKIWVLTGDKVETALNIALACGHIPEFAQKYFITECGHANDVKEHLNILESEMKHHRHLAFALLIDGKSLTFALQEHSTLFRDVTIRCSAVLCCRLSPLQKCQVVHLIKTAPEKYITAAIGDGANDVSMIQEAHVGLGIVGKEGRQAARCADYAFANFAMLKRILLVHGHYFTDRLAVLVLYFFYKNLVFMAIQFFFQYDSMFSSQSIYDSVFLTLFNVFFTSVPILCISLTEKRFTEETLTKKPALYKINTGNKRLHWTYFLGWTFLALYHALVVYLFSRNIWSNNAAILTTPYTVDYSCFGTFLMHNVVVLVNVKLWLEAVYQSYIFILTIWCSILGFVLLTVVYNFLDLTDVDAEIFIFKYDTDMYYVYNALLSSLTFYVLSFLIIVACLIPDFTKNVWTGAMNMKLPSIYPGVRLMKAREAAIQAQIRQNLQRPIESTYL